MYLAPIYVGVTFSPKTSSIEGNPMTMSYGFGEFPADNAALAAMKDVTIDNPVKPSDQKITGTADPETTISTELDDQTATTDADGNYTLKLSKSIADLGNPDTIKVYEGNDMGDTKSAEATVRKSVPVLKADSESLTVTPAQLEGLTGKSDSDVLTWLAGQAGITVNDSVSGDVDSAAKYESTDTDLAQKLTGLATNASTTIDVGADSNGVKATTDLAIKVTKSAGELKFTTVSDSLSYGNLKVPNATTFFAPTASPEIEISDTRVADSPWRVTATADTLVDTSDASRQLSGQLMYVNSDGQAESLAEAQTVASGTRATGVTTVKAVDGWETQADQPSGVGKTGIYLQAKPNIYTGGGQTDYSGNITWQLVDAP